MRDTIDMAREAGLYLARENPPYYGTSMDSLKVFEALVRADEREACAKVCDGLVRKSKLSVIPLNSWSTGVADCAAAIRARGETK
jgi:hypothetical protein